MHALKFLFTTDVGLFSIIGLAFMIFGIGGFFTYLFLFAKDRTEAQGYPETKERLVDQSV